jgi:ribosomal protection tetracycline resistance protein
MSRTMLNLGILAHVDAGKTTLTERLLYAAGVIDEIGSVDAGTTQTDSLALERQRGITIKSAVVSFAVGDRTVNLIDTPGHPDFIAEVERVLSVLDGAVLVISAVEGVQPQTRILLRALQRLRVPTLIFVNKIDRGGAGYERVLRAIAERLTPAIAALVTVRGLGTRAAECAPATGPGCAAGLAEVLAEHDDAILAGYLSGRPAPPPGRLRRELAAQTRRALVHPVFFGSALTGAGVDLLLTGIAELLPPAGRDAEGPVAGAVFKIERGPAGEKVAYVRMFSGTVRTRDRLRFGGDGEQRARKVTAISVFEGGSEVRRGWVSAGQIGKLWGLTEIRVGDRVGAPSPPAGQRQFAPPTLETVVTAGHRGDAGALRAALDQLAEQDPLINVRQDDASQLIWISLYGEVQKEVIGATLTAEYGLEVSFRETTTIHIERPAGTGAAVERLREAPNPFLATVGLRVEPAAVGSGVRFRLEVEPGSMPPAFFRAVEDTVRATLRQGRYGWAVTDCVVTLTHCGYLPRQSHAHQGFSKSMSSTGEDFRKLTPVVLLSALQRAGTVVCEPVHSFRLDAPADAAGALLPALAKLRAVIRAELVRGASAVIDGDIPAAEVQRLRQQLAALTRGEGVVECSFARYQPVADAIPARPRSDYGVLNRDEYLRRFGRGASRQAPSPR